MDNYFVKVSIELKNKLEALQVSHQHEISNLKRQYESQLESLTSMNEAVLLIILH